MKRSRTSSSSTSLSLSLTQQRRGGHRRRRHRSQPHHPTSTPGGTNGGDDDNYKPNNNNDRPLRGVNVSLSGLGSHEKDRLHRAVAGLGGRYSKDLNTSRTTHLIVSKPTGQKYDAVIKYMTHSRRPHEHPILVVGPSWIERCVSANRRVDEGPYLLIDTAVARQPGGREGEDDDATNDDRPPKLLWKLGEEEMPPPPPPPPAATFAPIGSTLGTGRRSANDVDDEAVGESGGQKEVTDPTALPLGRACDAILSSVPVNESEDGDEPSQDPRRYLFRRCSFLLVGYDHDRGHTSSPSSTGGAPSTNTTTTTDAGGEGNTSVDVDDENDEDDASLSGKVAALVRMGMGTTFHRDVDLSVTHVVVSEGVAGEAMMEGGKNNPNGIMIRNAIRSLVDHHPNRPFVISPYWLVASLHRGKLQPIADFPPRPRRPRPPPRPIPPRRDARPTPSTTSRMEVDTPPEEEGGDDGQSVVPSSAALARVEGPNPNQPKKKRSMIFRTSVFCILRGPPPPPGNDTDDHPTASASRYVNVDTEEVRGAIESNGGRVLTRRVLDAILADHHRVMTTTTGGRGKKRRSDERRRCCYVVTNGGFGFDPDDPVVTSSSSSSGEAGWYDPLLAELAESGVARDIVAVTPIWVHACVEEGCELPSLPLVHPMLFRPRKYPLRRLPSALLPHHASPPAGDGRGGDGGNNVNGITVAITGFVYSERFGLACLIRSIGATYTEALSHGNTHLICREATGPKYERAVEWASAGYDVHVVSVDWLYHVVRYGYYSKEVEGEGWEDRFSLIPPSAAAADDDDDAADDPLDSVEKAPQPKTAADASSEALLPPGGNMGSLDPVDAVLPKANLGGDNPPRGMMLSDEPPPRNDGTGADVVQMDVCGGGERLQPPPPRESEGGGSSSSSSASTRGAGDRELPEPPSSATTKEQAASAKSQDEPSAGVGPVLPPTTTDLQTKEDESSSPPLPTSEEDGTAAAQSSEPPRPSTVAVTSSSSPTMERKESSRKRRPTTTSSVTPPAVSDAADAERHARRLESSLLNIGAPLLHNGGGKASATGRRRRRRLSSAKMRRGHGPQCPPRGPSNHSGKENQMNGDDDSGRGGEREGESPPSRRRCCGDGQSVVEGGDDDATPSPPGRGEDIGTDRDGVGEGNDCGRGNGGCGGGGGPTGVEEESQVVWFAERTQQL